MESETQKRERLPLTATYKRWVYTVRGFVWAYKRGGGLTCIYPEGITGLQITVGHRTIADQNLPMSDKISTVVGHI